MTTSTRKQPDYKWIGIVFAVLLGLVLIIGWAFFSLYKRNKIKDKIISKLQNENNELKRAYLDLLQGQLILDHQTSPDIIEELERLKNQMTNLSQDAHIELKSVIELVQDGKHTKAVKDLAKIIENILWQKAEKEKTFKAKPPLAQLLEHAKKCMWITPHEQAYGELIKEIRNKEAHELNVQVEPHRIGLAIFSGIQIIYSLTKTV